MQNPVIFFWEIKESAFNSSHLCCLKSFLPLSYRHSEINSSLNNQDRCVPILNIIDRIELIVCFLCYGIVFFPVWPAKIPVIKENFLCSSKHALRIKNSIMSNKRLE